MANQSVVTKLTVSNQDRPEGCGLKEDGSWSSPPGGWLKAQDGKWVQAVTGVILKNSRDQELGLLEGLTFATAKVGDGGNFHDTVTPDSGHWTVTATT